MSCDRDLLDPLTPGALTEDVAIVNSNDLQRIMNSSYNLMFNREEAVFTSVFTDEAAIGFANGGQGINDNYIFFLNVSTPSVNSIWTGYYVALSRINRVIAASAKIVAVGPADQQLIDRLKAEALIARAFCHSKILSYFTTNMTDDSALAGILADRVITTGDPSSLRSTNGQFYLSMHTDLNTAISILSSNTSTLPVGAANVRTYYAGLNAAKALKARIFAMKGDYINAEIWANDVITSSGINLATPVQYQQVFFTDNEPANTEVIWRLKRTAPQNSQAGTAALPFTGNLHNGWCSIRPNISGSPFYEISRALFNAVNANPTDIRRNTMVAPSSVIDPNYATSTDYRNTDRLIINKHGGVAIGTGTAAVTTANGFNNDIKLMRLSEVYLIKAEARVKANDLVGAATAIKSILDRRFPIAQSLPVYATNTAAWKAILDQRRLELAFEGHRFIDLKRLGVLAGVSGVDRDAADYTSSSANYPAANPSNFPINSAKFALPIPQDELNSNSVIQQNPGY